MTMFRFKAFEFFKLGPPELILQFSKVEAKLLECADLLVGQV